MIKIFFFAALALLVGCVSSAEYTSSGGAVLVRPTHRAWLKVGSTMDDENIARKECGEELRNNLELRRESAKFDEEVRLGLRKDSSKKNRDPWSAAYVACMNRKGFKYYEDP